MASNCFGSILAMTTFGESHGSAMGMVMDGCPAGLVISREEIQREVNRRRPGTSHLTSSRNEIDEVEILSGIFEGKTTGAPIAILIKNRDVDSSVYESLKDLYRPGHADFSYEKKYGVVDYRGGGRASARETCVRVAAGAIAKKIIEPITITAEVENAEELQKKIEEAIQEGDSIGGSVACTISSVPPGLGSPIYRSLPARLAHAMFSIPGLKGLEIGSGYLSSCMKGSEHNDAFIEGGQTETNYHGGVLGGITTGMPIVFRLSFKPPSSMKKMQRTITKNGEEISFCIPRAFRSHPCIAWAVPPVVEAMAALVVAESLLENRLARMDDKNRVETIFSK